MNLNVGLVAACTVLLVWGSVIYAPMEIMRSGGSTAVCWEPWLFVEAWWAGDHPDVYWTGMSMVQALILLLGGGLSTCLVRREPRRRSRTAA